MIVKNEAQVIRRALASVCEHIDYWIICDTGSTDGTQDIIREALQHLPGELHDVEWKNFGHNRTEVLRLARSKTAYSLILDADMVLNVKAPFKELMLLDMYLIRYEGLLDYCQPMLVSNGPDWEYKGLTHEYLDAPQALTSSFMPAISLTHYGDGGSRADKYERDIQILRQSLESEPDNPRTLFYLAQSCKDLGRWEEALGWYAKRAAAAGFEEERWYAAYQAAEMKRLLGHPWPEVLAAHLAAFEARPHRLEPVFAIARHYRLNGRFQAGYLYAAMAIQGPAYPDEDVLFIDRPVYGYALLVEYVICAFNCGRLSETIKGANFLLENDELPEETGTCIRQLRMCAVDLIWGEGKEPDGSPANKIKVIVPFHNAGKFLKQCLQSLQEQDYDDFEVLLIDDASTDENSDDLPDLNFPARLFRNKKRKGVAFNLHRAITQHCETDDIVVCLDGDDWLAGPNVLSSIARQYARYDCWILYGQYRESGGVAGLSAPYASPADFETLRQNWRFSHIRSFRAGLFHRIADQDPGYACLKDEAGNWLQSAADAAIMFPLAEMAGFLRTRFTEEISYIYNLDNPLSHHNSNKEKQAAHFRWVAAGRPFAAITDYRPKLKEAHSANQKVLKQHET